MHSYLTVVLVELVVMVLREDKNREIDMPGMAIMVSRVAAEVSAVSLHYLADYTASRRMNGIRSGSGRLDQPSHISDRSYPRPSFLLVEVRGGSCMALLTVNPLYK